MSKGREKDRQRLARLSARRRPANVKPENEKPEKPAGPIVILRIDPETDQTGEVDQATDQTGDADAFEVEFDSTETILPVETDGTEFADALVEFLVG